MMGSRWTTWAVRGLALLTALAVPVFLTTSSVRWAFNDLRLYLYGFEKYRVSEATGIAPQDLRRVARSIRDYFNDERPWLVVVVPIEGEERLLFNRRELLHMRDVKALVRGVYRVQEGSLLLLGAVVAGAGLAARRRGLLRALGWVMWGGWTTVALVVLVGIGVVVAFPWLFYLFHILSFRNPYWMLDPRQDYLIRLFPEGFWFDATLFVALATLVGGLLVAAACGLARRALARLPKGDKAGV